MNILLGVASGLTALVCLLHIFGGGPAVVLKLIKRPDEPGEVGGFTAYYAWHLVTLRWLRSLLPSGWRLNPAARANWPFLPPTEPWLLRSGALQ